MTENYFYTMLFFFNERKTTFHAITERNKRMRLSPIETILLGRVKETYCQIHKPISDCRNPAHPASVWKRRVVERVEELRTSACCRLHTYA